MFKVLIREDNGVDLWIVLRPILFYFLSVTCMCITMSRAVSLVEDQLLLLPNVNWLKKRNLAHLLGCV